MMKDKVFDELKDIQNEMINFLGEVNSLTAGSTFLSNKNVESYWQPNYDAFETDNKFILIIELAGVKKEDINVSLGANYIKIFGQRKLTSERNGLCYYNLEIETGKFQRKIYFPDLPIDLDNHKVIFEDGILRLEFDIREVKEVIIPIE